MFREADKAYSASTTLEIERAAMTASALSFGRNCRSSSKEARDKALSEPKWSNESTSEALPTRRAGVPRRITRKNHSERAFQRRRSSARLREQLREYFEVRFRAEKYGVPYFFGSERSDPRKEAAGARARNAVEDLNGGHRREALGVGRLSRRRHSCPKDARGFGMDLA